MTKLFGTDGMRSNMYSYPMDIKTICKLGVAISLMAKKLKHNSFTKIVIGNDTRESCGVVQEALLSGLLSININVVLLGVIPTPAVAFLTTFLDADFGIMISASHNPYYDNGIKLFDNAGVKLSVEVEKEIEDLIFNADINSLKTCGSVSEFACAEKEYTHFLMSTIPSLGVNKKKIVLDGANGATCHVVENVFKFFNADVMMLGNSPNGKNINHKCGSICPEFLSSVVIKENADVGFAFDGDGDRVIMCDENGLIKDGDQLVAVIASNWNRLGKLKKKTVVGTVMSNLALEDYLSKFGVDFIRTYVGDRYISQLMRSCGCNLGGEASGHIILGDYLNTGDGILTALQIYWLICSANLSVSDFCSDFIPFSRAMINIECKNEDMNIDFKNIDVLARKIESSFCDESGRVFIRKSGTERVIRVVIEYENKSLTNLIEKKFKDVLHIKEFRIIN